MKSAMPLGLLISFGMLMSSCSVRSAVDNSAHGAGFVLLDGDRQAVIVFNPDDGPYHAHVQKMSYELKAQEDLANYLEKATGKKFAVLPESEYKPGAGVLPIYVGNCAATREAIGEQLAGLDRDGFIVRVETNRVFLAGRMIHSTCWAEQQFLEDNLGIRWLFPGELGTDIPHADKVVVPVGQKVEQPVILSRLWSGANSTPDGVDWSFRQRIFYSDAGPNTFKGRYEFHHNMSVIFPPDKYFDQHPEYYALINGKRERAGYSGGVNMCYSNPETVKVAAETAIEYFKQNPQAESFSFGPGDGSHWCECENCRKLFLDVTKWQKAEPDNDMANVWGTKMRASLLYWSWLTQVAAIVEKECPGKKLGALAYDGYTVPPVLNPELKVNPDIQPYITFTEADLWQPDHSKHVHWLIDEWAKRVKSFGLFDYAFGEGMVQPKIYTPLIQQLVKEYASKGLKGCYGEVYPNWGADGPRLYQTAKIWWNPDVDLNADLDDWCRHAFKEAAGPMEDHFRRCQEEWVSTDQDKYNFGKRPESIGAFGKKYQFSTGYRTTPIEIFTPEVIAEHTAFFDEAAKLARDEKVKARIAWYRGCWDTGLVFADAYWAGEGLETYIARGATLQQAAAALKKMPASYAPADWQKVINTRMKADKIAWYPVTDQEAKTYLMVKPVRDEDLRWCAKQIVDNQKRRQQVPGGPSIEEAVKTDIAGLFETGMEQANDNYKKAVEKISAAAAEELKKQ